MQFYGISEKEIQQSEKNGGHSLGEMHCKKRKTTTNLNSTLMTKASAIANDVITDHREQELLRINQFTNILSYMMDNLDRSKTDFETTFIFIGSSKNVTTKFSYPKDFDKRAIIEPSWLHWWWSDFVIFCKDYGFDIQVSGIVQQQLTARSYSFKPASTISFETMIWHLPHSTLKLKIKAAITKE